MLKLLIIADDFTGALDTGVQFSNQGIITKVTTDINCDYSSIDPTIEVLVVDTESRYLSFDESYQKIVKILTKAKENNIPFIYKKVDSALRGNISAEIKAILDKSSDKIIPFLPSYPEMKRFLIEGNLYIDDVLVSESVFSDDPYEPVTESNVIRRLKQEAGIEAQLVSGNSIPSDAQGLLVFDSQSNEEMEKQMNALVDSNLLSITIGCAGFAKILANRLFPNKRPVQYALDEPLIVISGSVNPITRRQIEYAEEKNYPRISLSSDQLLKSAYWKSIEGEKDIQSYVELVKDQSLIIFETLSDETTDAIREYNQGEDIPISKIRFRIGKSLGELTQELWLKIPNNTFMFTGGDTLFQSMEVLGINQISPIAEISAGVVLSTIEWNQDKMNVITKSGGFGNENLFEEIISLVKGN